MNYYHTTFSSLTEILDTFLSTNQRHVLVFSNQSETDLTDQSEPELSADYRGRNKYSEERPRGIMLECEDESEM